MPSIGKSSPRFLFLLHHIYASQWDPRTIKIPRTSSGSLLSSREFRSSSSTNTNTTSDSSSVSDPSETKTDTPPHKGIAKRLTTVSDHEDLISSSDQSSVQSPSVTSPSTKTPTSTPFTPSEPTEAHAMDFGLLGLDGATELYFNPQVENPYGKPGQWLLKKTGLSFVAGDDTESAGGYEANKNTHSPISSLRHNNVQLYDNSTVFPDQNFAPVNCMDSQADWEKISPFVTNGFRDIPEFVGRKCGGRPIKCGRMVFDQALSPPLLNTAYSYRNSLISWPGLRVVQSLLEKHFETGPLVPVGGQLDSNIRADLPCEMHTDYLSRPPHYFLTAIIYLVDQGKECKRCETIFNDSLLQGEFSKGVIVQPRKGRLVLFSGGMENMHCKMPSVGHRDVIQLWFACKDEIYGGGNGGGYASYGAGKYKGGMNVVGADKMGEKVDRGQSEL